MADKGFVVGLILFIMIGVASYDRYLTEQGGVSPVGQFIDFAGLSSFKKPDGKTMRTTSRWFHSNKVNDLGRLRMKYQDIENQRVALSQNRDSILSEIAGLNTDMELEAMNLQKVLMEEQNNFKTIFPEMEGLGPAAVTGGLSGNLQGRPLSDTEFQNLKIKITDLLSRVTGSPDEKWVDLSGYFDTIDSIDALPETQFPMECGSRTECLENELNGIRMNISELIQEDIDEPMQDLGNIIEIIRQLEREHQILAENQAARDLRLEEFSEKAGSELKILTEKLTDVGEDDLSALMDLFDEFEQEQEWIIENLQLNYTRLRESYARGQNQLRQLMGKMQNSSHPGRQSILIEWEGWQQRTHDLLSALKDNERQMYQNYSDRFGVSKSLAGYQSRVNRLPTGHDRDISENRTQAMDRQGGQSTDSPHRFDIKSSLRPVEDPYRSQSSSKTQRMIERARQSDKQHRSADDQMRRLRNKAQRNGF